MKKKIVGIFVCMLLVSIPVFSLSASANLENELKVGVFGASIMTGLRMAGGIIFNDNDDYIVNDIYYTIAITGGFDDSIDITITNYIEELLPNSAILHSIQNVYGFGPVTMTIAVTSSSVGDVTETIKGFQIGPYTISQPYALAWY